MGVFKRGRYWWISYSYEGRTIRESTRTPEKKLAMRVLAKRQTAIFEDRFDIHEAKHRPQFSDFAKEYLETYSKINKTPQSHRRDHTSIKNLNNHFGNYRLNEIKPMLIEQYKRKRLEAGRMPATINRELACMKHMYTIAVRNEIARSNPVKMVRFLREDNVIQRVLSRSDEEKLLEFAKPSIKRVVICALETGMRLSEILNLLWKDVDMNNSTITVRKTKTGRIREIPISRRLMDVFGEIRKESSSGHVFRHSDGSPIKSLKEGYKNALANSGLKAKNYRFHDMRHTFATRLAESGVDVFTIKELLGHSTILTTQRYAHPGRKVKRDAIAELSRRE